MVDEESTGDSSVPLLPVKQENIYRTSNFGALVYIAWNLGLAIASVAVLCSSLREQPNHNIRAWISIDALLSVIAVILFLVYEYEARAKGEPSSFVTGCRIINTLLYLLWWMIGILCASSGREIFFRDAPLLAKWVMVLLIIPPLFIWFFICFTCCNHSFFAYTSSSSLESQPGRNAGD